MKGLIGTLEAALSASFLVTNTLMEAQSRALSAHQTVPEAIRLRDTAGARAAMNRLLDIAAEDLRALITCHLFYFLADRVEWTSRMPTMEA